MQPEECAKPTGELSFTKDQMHNFEILFDDAEPSCCEDPAYERYGKLAFPPPPSDRPWIYSNFVQSLDGIASFKGRHATGSDISQLREDRWLMDFLRAHADAILLGINTLMEETQLSGNRGPVYSIEDPAIRKLREKLGLGREKNIFVTGAAYLNLHDYEVFNSDLVETFIITTAVGARRLADKKSHPRVKIIVAGEETLVDLGQAMRILQQDYGINRLLCEGGPTLYGYMSRAGLIDEKFLTISPLEIGMFVPPEQEPSDAERSNPPKERPTTFMAPGFVKENAPLWEWLSSRRIGDHQFNHYRRRRPATTSSEL
jgi:riboflavin biosynthesis pyrimidine reductase